MQASGALRLARAAATRYGGIAAAAQRYSGISAAAQCQGGIAAAAQRFGGLSAAGALSAGGAPRTAAAAAAAAARRGLAAKADAGSALPEVKDGVAGDTPSIFDQATGLERAEIDHPDLFKHNEVLRGPFGTEENPVLIQSNFDSRIVGCTGGAAPDDHDLFWINVEKGSLATCPECNQVFKLDPL